MKNYISFDIGGTNVKHGVLNEKGEVLIKGLYSTNVETDEIFINDLVKVVKDYQKEYEVSGIAISMPGFIDTKRGIPTVCYAINCMEGKSITDILSEKTGLSVSVENDGNCAALAEKFNGNATQCSDFICFTIGTGIGGGIFLNNQIIRGKSFKGGEFGYMICRNATEDNRGRETLSTNASTYSLINFYKDYNGIERNELVEGHTVFEEAEKDEKVMEIVNEWYKSIALGIFNLSATLNPEKILIGGGISSKEGFINRLVEELKKLQVWGDVETIIDVCKHKNDAGLIGAVYNFLQENK